MKERHTTIVIEQVLYAGTQATIELPDGLAWEDIADWWVGWDTLHYTTGDNEWHEIVLDSSQEDVIDWKRPQSTYVLTEDYSELDRHDRP